MSTAIKRGRKWEPEPDEVDRAFAMQGYTMPGTNLNVATAKSIVRQLIFNARADERRIIETKVCGRCKAKFEREAGGVF